VQPLSNKWLRGSAQNIKPIWFLSGKTAHIPPEGVV
jgi:hypothetical protein